MIYKPKIKVNGVEIEMGGGTSTSPFLSCAELSDVVSKNGLEIGAAAASCLKVTITNPHKASFDGDKVELYISEIDDGETTTKERIEAEVGDSSTTELIDTSEEIYANEPDEEEGEPLTDDELAEVETYASELEDLQIKFFEGEPMTIVDVETAGEEDPEWELLGTFYVRSQTSSADSVILACYDNISRLNMQYSQAETAQTFAGHWAAIKAELAEYGIPLDDFESTDTTPLQFLPLTTMRDALSLLAGYAGGFLACAPDGSLGISFYGFAGEILIRDDLLSISDTSSGEIVVDAIECENAHGEIITAGGGGQAVRMSNYLVSQGVLESVIVPLYRGTRYTGGVLSCPWSRELAAGEFIRVMTAEEYRNYLMLLNSAEDTRALRSSLGQVLIVSSQVIKFGGTATTTVYSACDSETAKAQYTQAPLKKQIIQTDKKAEDAAHTATDFIAPQSTSSTDDGIKVFPKSEKDNPQNYSQINQQGMQIYKGGQRTASFGANGIVLGIDKNAQTIVTADGIKIANADGIVGVSVDSSGTSQVATKVVNVYANISQGSSYTLTLDSSIASGTSVEFRVELDGYSEFNEFFTITVGTNKSGTFSGNVQFSYMYNATNKQIKITANQNDNVVLCFYRYDVTSDLPLVQLNGVLEFNGEQQKDIKIEVGTSGNWTYEKWSSGIVKMYYTGTYSSAFDKGNYFGAYRGTGQTLTYPFTLASVIYANVDHIAPNTGFCLLSTYDTTQLKFYPYNRTNLTATQTGIKVIAEVVGRWKRGEQQ